MLLLIAAGLCFGIALLHAGIIFAGPAALRGLLARRFGDRARLRVGDAARMAAPSACGEGVELAPTLCSLVKRWERGAFASKQLGRHDA